MLALELSHFAVFHKETIFRLSFKLSFLEMSSDRLVGPEVGLKRALERHTKVVHIEPVEEARLVEREETLDSLFKNLIPLLWEVFLKFVVVWILIESLKVDETLLLCLSLVEVSLSVGCLHLLTKWH